MKTKSERRKAHTDFCNERNRRQGHTGGPNSRGKQRPAGIERPSYHKPKPKKFIEIEGGIEITSVQIFDDVEIVNYVNFDSGPEYMAEYDELRAEAKRRKKSFKKIASAAGWELVDPNPKAVNRPESWQRRV